jgi:hypothetical protein
MAPVLRVWLWKGALPTYCRERLFPGAAFQARGKYSKRVVPKQFRSQCVCRSKRCPSSCSAYDHAVGPLTNGTRGAGPDKLEIVIDATIQTGFSAKNRHGGFPALAIDH